MPGNVRHVYVRCLQEAEIHLPEGEDTFLLSRHLHDKSSTKIVEPFRCALSPEQAINLGANLLGAADELRNHDSE